MSILMRASEISTRPVVSLDGEAVAQIKDIVYAANGGEVGGFTLAGRGLLAGPMKQALPWSQVVALGRDAVMIESEDSLSAADQVTTGSGAGGGDVLGSRVLTDTGTDLGKVVDVIIEVADARGSRADVVGYEIEPSAAMNTTATKVLIPLPDTLAASGQHLIVPASAAEFVSDDLAGFGAAVATFRAQLEAGV